MKTKRLLAWLLVLIMCFTLVSCQNDKPEDNSSETASVEQSNESTEQSTESVEQSTESDEQSTESAESSDESTEQSTESAETSDESAESSEEQITVFNTENISRITLYAYYGAGKGSEVPAENMEEIKNWLDTFTIGEKAPDIVPPGTNTYFIEFEYTNGTVIKTGMDTITVDGTTYYTKSQKQPECFLEIIDKTSLK